MIRVEVTKEDIAEGLAGNCHACPVALALHRATDDDDANVHKYDWTLRVEVWGRSIRAPHEVQEFVHQFDGLPRDNDGRWDPKAETNETPKPFRFELPDITNDEWKERCEGCQELVGQSELNTNGLCKACRKGKKPA